MILPPGTILQLMYLKERLHRVPPGRFIEVGVGRGFVAQALLAMGWRGVGYELNEEAVKIARATNQAAVDTGYLLLRVEDWLHSEETEPVDLVISSMVLEHLNTADEQEYFDRCKRSLAQGGRIILFVPGSPVHRGIEDEIAGHYRRYTFADIQSRLTQHGFTQSHVVGLTYPLSNWLLPVSDLLVRRAEDKKQRLSMREKTLLSGHRSVPFKTTFPNGLGLILNRATLWPFHVLQKWCKRNSASLVIYGEAVRP